MVKIGEQPQISKEDDEEENNFDLPDRVINALPHLRRLSALERAILSDVLSDVLSLIYS